MKRLIELIKNRDKKTLIIIGVSAAVLISLILMFIFLRPFGGRPEDTTGEENLSQTDTAETKPLLSTKKREFYSCTIYGFVV